MQTLSDQSFKLDFNFRKISEAKSHLQLKTTSQPGPMLLFMVLVWISSWSFMSDMVQGEPMMMYMVSGFFLLTIGILVFSIYRRSAGFTGELLIDGSKGLITRDNGLSALKAKEFKVGHQGVLVIDGYTQKEGKTQYTYSRLSIVEQAASEKLLQSLSQGVEKYRHSIQWTEPKLPVASTCIAISSDETPLRVIAEAIAKTLQWDIFDLNAVPALHRPYADLDRPFSREQAVSVDLDTPPGGVQVRDNVLKVYQYPMSFRVLMAVIAVVSIGFMGNWFYQMGIAMGITAFAMPLMIALLVVMAGNTATEITADREGVAVGQKLLGIAPLSPAKTISWKELEELKVRPVAGMSSFGYNPCRLEIVSDTKRLDVLVSTPEQAQWLAGYIGGKTTVK